MSKEQSRFQFKKYQKLSITTMDYTKPQTIILEVPIDFRQRFWLYRI